MKPYDIVPIKKAEQSIELDTSAAKGNIAHPKAVVNSFLGNSKKIFERNDDGISNRLLLTNALETPPNLKTSNESKSICYALSKE